jgi:hypothetical protein
MSKWADYLISGVWFTTQNNSKRISHVMLHTDSDNTFEKGIKTSESEVIKLLKNKKSVITITWNYPEWRQGAEVTYETVQGQEYLRTGANATTKDNLDNSVDMHAFA